MGLPVGFIHCYLGMDNVASFIMLLLCCTTSEIRAYSHGDTQLLSRAYATALQSRYQTFARLFSGIQIAFLLLAAACEAVSNSTMCGGCGSTAVLPWPVYNCVGSLLQFSVHQLQTLTCLAHLQVVE